MSAATGLSQENITHFQTFTQAYVDQFGIAGPNPLDQFLKSIQVLHGSPAINSDETRTKRFFQEVSTGTIALVDSSGAYTGTDFNASRVQYENLVTITQQGGTFSIAERNIAKFNHFINSIVTTKAGIAKASREFRTQGYGEIVRKEILAKIATKVKNDLITILDNATTDTVYGDVVISNGGTGLQQDDNLITGGWGSTSVDDIIANLVAQTDYHGNQLDFATPYAYIADTAKYTTVLKAVKTSQTTNVNSRNALDYFGENAVVVPLGINAGDVHAFTGDKPLVLLSETENPVVKVGYDKLGNLVIRGYFIYKFGWKGRNGLCKVSN